MEVQVDSLKSDLLQITFPTISTNLFDTPWKKPPALPCSQPWSSPPALQNVRHVRFVHYQWRDLEVHEYAPHELLLKRSSPGSAFDTNEEFLLPFPNPEEEGSECYYGFCLSCYCLLAFQ